MPRFSLANAPVSLFCLRRTNDEIAGQLNACAFIGSAAPCAIYVHTDPDNESERWIDVYPQATNGEIATIRISILSGGVTTTYQRNGNENTIRALNIPNAEKDFLKRMRADKFWRDLYYVISNLWHTFEHAFISRIFDASEAESGEGGKRDPLEIRMTGAPRGINMREDIPLKVWRESPSVDWFAGTIELPAGRSKWSGVTVEVAGGTADTPTARKLDLIRRCKEWLEMKMDCQPYITQPKKECLAEAKIEFDLLSEGVFDTAWREACEKIQKKHKGARWGKAGAPKKPR